MGEIELIVFGGEKVQDGSRVWEYDFDGNRIEGSLEYFLPGWLVNWDDGQCTYVLNPLQLHKI